MTLPPKKEKTSQERAQSIDSCVISWEVLPYSASAQ